MLVTVSEVELSDLRQELMFRLKKKIKQMIKRICKEVFIILIIFFHKTNQFIFIAESYCIAVDWNLLKGGWSY